MSITTPYFRYGKLIADAPISDFQVTGLHEITICDAEQLYLDYHLGSYHAVDSLERFNNASALFHIGKTGLALVVYIQRSFMRDRGWYYPEYNYVILPSKYVNQHLGNVVKLNRLAQKLAGFKMERSIDYYTCHSVSFTQPMGFEEKLEITEPPTPPTTDDYYRSIKRLKQYEFSPHTMTYLLSCIMQRQPLYIINAPETDSNNNIRLEIVNDLLLMVPEENRCISYATDVFDPKVCNVEIGFLYEENRFSNFNWHKPQLTQCADVPLYVQRFTNLWSEDADTLAEQLHSNPLLEIRKHDLIALASSSQPSYAAMSSIPPSLYQQKYQKAWSQLYYTAQNNPDELTEVLTSVANKGYYPQTLVNLVLLIKKKIYAADYSADLSFPQISNALLTLNEQPNSHWLVIEYTIQTLRLMISNDFWQRYNWPTPEVWDILLAIAKKYSFTHKKLVELLKIDEQNLANPEFQYFSLYLAPSKRDLLSYVSLYTFA